MFCNVFWKPDTYFHFVSILLNSSVKADSFAGIRLFEERLISWFMAAKYKHSLALKILCNFLKNAGYKMESIVFKQ